MNEEGTKGESQDQNSKDDVFLMKTESNMVIKMALRGIPYINKVFNKSGEINKFYEKDVFNTQTKWMLDTEGVNMLVVMCHGYVDVIKTTTNHLIEVIEVLGIENHVSKGTGCTNNDGSLLDMER